jgi:hypothetical protein
MGGVGKRIITKTWMSEIFLQGRILRVGVDALIMQLALEFITYLSLKFDELSFFVGRAKCQDSEVRGLFASGKMTFFVTNFTQFAKNTFYHK